MVVAAVDAQASAGIAEQFGVSMLPAIMWVQPSGESIAIANYQAPRSLTYLMNSLAVGREHRHRKLPGAEITN